MEKLLFSSYRASGISERQGKNNLTPLTLYKYFKAQINSGPTVGIVTRADLRSLLSLCHPPSP